MSSPEWKVAIAADGVTEVRTARLDDGTTTIKLSSGAVSILAAVDVAAADFLFSRAAPDAGAAA